MLFGKFTYSFKIFIYETHRMRHTQKNDNGKKKPRKRNGILLIHNMGGGERDRGKKKQVKCKNQYQQQIF